MKRNIVRLSCVMLGLILLSFPSFGGKGSNPSSGQESTTDFPQESTRQQRAFQNQMVEAAKDLASDPAVVQMLDRMLPEIFSPAPNDKAVIPYSAANRKALEKIQAANPNLFLNIPHHFALSATHRWALERNAQDWIQDQNTTAGFVGVWTGYLDAKLALLNASHPQEVLFLKGEALRPKNTTALLTNLILQKGTEEWMKQTLNKLTQQQYEFLNQVATLQQQERLRQRLPYTRVELSPQQQQQVFNVQAMILNAIGFAGTTLDERIQRILNIEEPLVALKANSPSAPAIPQALPIELSPVEQLEDLVQLQKNLLNTIGDAVRLEAGSPDLKKQRQKLEEDLFENIKQIARITTSNLRLKVEETLNHSDIFKGQLISQFAMALDDKENLDDVIRRYQRLLTAQLNAGTPDPALQQVADAWKLHVDMSSVPLAYQHFGWRTLIKTLQTHYVNPHQNDSGLIKNLKQHEHIAKVIMTFAARQVLEQVLKDVSTALTAGEKIKDLKSLLLFGIQMHPTEQDILKRYAYLTQKLKTFIKLGGDFLNFQETVDQVKDFQEKVAQMASGFSGHGVPTTEKEQQQAYDGFNKQFGAVLQTGDHPTHPDFLNFLEGRHTLIVPQVQVIKIAKFALWQLFIKREALTSGWLKHLATQALQHPRFTITQQVVNLQLASLDRLETLTVEQLMKMLSPQMAMVTRLAQAQQLPGQVSTFMTWWERHVHDCLPARGAQCMAESCGRDPGDGIAEELYIEALWRKAVPNLNLTHREHLEPYVRNALEPTTPNGFSCAAEALITLMAYGGVQTRLAQGRANPSTLPNTILPEARQSYLRALAAFEAEMGKEVQAVLGFEGILHPLKEATKAS